MNAGGERFDYVPALNARPAHAALLAAQIARHCQGWTQIELGLHATAQARDTSV